MKTINIVSKADLKSIFNKKKDLVFLAVEMYKDNLNIVNWQFKLFLHKKNVSCNLIFIQPGPGQYNAEKVKSKKKIVIGHKTRNPCQEAFLNEKAIDNNPAPNKYNICAKVPKTGKIVTLSMRFTEGG